MKPEWRRFAPIGLYIALVAAVIGAGLFIIQREWNIWLQICLGLVVIGLALFAILDPERVRVALTGRQARYGSNALVLALAFIGILVVINYLSYTNSKRWDLTEDQQNTLAPETITTLQNLKQPVLAKAFFTSQYPSDTAKTLLDQFKFNSKGKFNYEFIDPNQNPVAAKEAKITRDGSIVVSMGDQQRIVDAVSEQDLTGSLVKLMNPETRIVYFLTGHGEPGVDDATQKGYSQAKATLESKNYSVKTLNILADNKIPDDAKVIVVANPNKPLDQSEVDLIAAFLVKGGKLIVMEEPLPLTNFGDSADPLADYLKETWGITLGRDLVVDFSSNQPSVAIGSQYGNHPITQNLGGMASVFPTARSITTTQESKAGSIPVQLVMTSSQAWGETDLAALSGQNPQVKPDPGVDLLGPVPLAAASDDTKTGARVVVFGDADFASNQFYLAYANGDLFTNSIDWVAGQEELINLTPKKNTQRLLLPPQKITYNLIALVTIVIIPGIVLVSGIAVWVQHRKRG